MSLRMVTEQWERDHLSSFATLVVNSQGRGVNEEECQVRTAYQRDRDRILHSKAFRRLKGKTQVFIAPEGDHYRTRLTHTLEVAQISRTVARALRLNEDLTEAIALGHDLGHTPFGHAGETALELLFGGFRHNEQSLRVVDYVERPSTLFFGLNLTQEVREGILGHTGVHVPKTLEGQIVRICDRVAYLNHDIEDAVRGFVLKEEDLPSDVVSILGRNRSERIDTMVKDLIAQSADKGEIRMSKGVGAATNKLRDFLFRTVYIGSSAKAEEEKVYNILRMFFSYYVANPLALEERVGYSIKKEELKRHAVDFIAGMTDSYAIKEFQRLFLPKGWSRL